MDSFGSVEIVRGVVGPERVIQRERLLAGGQRLDLDIRFDDDLRRYVIHELLVSRDSVAASAEPVTAEVIRSVRTSAEIALALLAPSDGTPLITELANPGGEEPWGLQVPADLVGSGPSPRALRWVAHFYRYGQAIDDKPTKAVEELMGLARATAGRWIVLAREATLLNPSQGPGRGGG